MPSDTIAEVLRRAVHSLAQHSESPRLDAEVLLGKVLGVPRSALIVRGSGAHRSRRTSPVSNADRAARTGTPVAYLTGTREFWSLQLDVTPAVLVPRPETETLVELALRLLPVDGERLGSRSGHRQRRHRLGHCRGAAPRAGDRRRHLTGGPWRREEKRARARTAAGRVAARFMVRAGGGRALRPDRRQSAVRGGYGSGAREARRRACACAALAGRPDWNRSRRSSSRQPRTSHRRAGCCSSTAAAKDRDVARLLERRGFSAVRSHDDYSGRPRVTLGTIHLQH